MPPNLLKLNNIFKTNFYLFSLILNFYLATFLCKFTRVRIDHLRSFSVFNYYIVLSSQTIRLSFNKTNSLILINIISLIFFCSFPSRMPFHTNLITPTQVWSRKDRVNQSSAQSNSSPTDPATVRLDGTSLSTRSSNASLTASPRASSVPEVLSLPEAESLEVHANVTFSNLLRQLSTLSARVNNLASDLTHECNQTFQRIVKVSQSVDRVVAAIQQRRIPSNNMLAFRYDRMPSL